MKTLRDRWWPHLGKIERTWILVCVTCTFLLLLLHIAGVSK